MASALRQLKRSWCSLKGRARAKIGPVATWVPVEGTAYFKFPFSMRWNFTMRPAGVSLSSGEEAFDSMVCRKRHNREPIIAVSDAEQVASSQARVWTAGAVLLMPLTEYYVELSMSGERELDATNTDAHITTRLTLKEDHTLDSTADRVYQPLHWQTAEFLDSTVRRAGSHRRFDAAAQNHCLWDSQPEFELAPVAVEINAAYSEALFRLESN